MHFDLRCIIATNNSVDFLSVDHKPYDHNERLRIERAGGTVQYDRVDGDLAVSRALGDFHWKQRSDLRPSQQKVCNGLVSYQCKHPLKCIKM